MMALAPAAPLVRLAGFLSLLGMAAGIFTEYFVLGTVIKHNDIAATVHNIQASEMLYRAGFAADLVDYTTYVGVTLILYQMLKGVGGSAALAALVFGLVGSAVVAAISLYYLAPLTLLTAPVDAVALEPSQVQALVLMSFKLRAIGYNISLVFFGLHLWFVGLLISSSVIVPRVLGLLLAIGGACYLVDGLAVFLLPQVTNQLSAYILVPGVLAQGSLGLWLFAMGSAQHKMQQMQWTVLHHARHAGPPDPVHAMGQYSSTPTALPL